jgi:hypothetical protein
MKIQQSHYKQLSDKMIPFIEKHKLDITQALESTCYRWDIYWNCGGAFTNASQYHYLDDNNIDTAIKSILKSMLVK